MIGSGGSASKLARSGGARRTRPGERPRPDLPPGTDLLPLIRHIVVLIQENHSFDNYLGALHNAPGPPLHRLASTVQQKGNPHPDL